MRLLRLSVRHLSGPEEVLLKENELVVLCLVRDGRPYVRSFIEHYRTLGVKHIVFLDNGSTDGTVEAASEYENVTVLQTKLPYKKYKYLMKQYLIRRFGSGRWSLYVDIDELFDYPYSDVVDLNSFLGYLGSGSYTAVTAQMLDMFPDGPLSNQEPGEDVELKKSHRFYDLSNLWRTRMKDHPRLLGSTIESESVEVFRGGIRDTVFGIRANLTKFPLTYDDGRVKPMDNSSHRVNNARVADITCVLYHYKFVGDFYEQASRAVREGNYYDQSSEYRRYLEALEKTPDLQMRRKTSRELENTGDLLLDCFLNVSEDYVDWVNAVEEQNVLREADNGESEPAEDFLESRRRTRANVLELHRRERRLRGRDQDLWHAKKERLGELREAWRSGKRNPELAEKIKRLKQEIEDRTDLRSLEAAEIAALRHGKDPESVRRFVLNSGRKKEPASGVRPGGGEQGKLSEHVKPLFVNGCQRSGTTAFVDYLNEHREILVCQERYKRIPRDRITPAFFTFERILDYRLEETNKPWNLELYRQRHAEILARKDPAEVKWVGDKNPGAVKTMDVLARNNPGARFITLYRPVEEVLESWEARAQDPDDHWSRENSGIKAIEAWNVAQRRTREFIESSPIPRVLIVSYHDFFSGEKDYATLISNFLGVEFDGTVRDKWKEMSSEFASSRREKQPLNEEQELLVREHADREAEAWVLDRIGRQWSDPGVYVGYDPDVALAALDRAEARAYRFEHQPGESGVDEVADEDQASKHLKERNRLLARQVRSLERQVESIKGSRTWRLIGKLQVLRARVFRR